MDQSGLTLSPFPSGWKSHFLWWVYITPSPPILHGRAVIQPPLILQQKHFPSLQNEWFCLFALKVNVIQEYTKQARFSTLRIQNTLDCISVKTFHIKHDLSWGQGKIKVGQNNKQIPHEQGMAVWAISSRHVTFSISTSGRTNRLRGGIRVVNH